MEIKLFNTWDAEIFTTLIEFKASVQSGLSTFFPETVQDYDKFFKASSPFLQDYDWQGFLLSRDGVPVAKAILCWRRGSSIANLGFIDWINDESVAKRLAQEVEDFSRAQDLEKLRSPVDLNFFIKYRIKCPGGGEPFYGEPVYPDYYHRLFEVCGYQVVGSWDTFRADVWSTILDYTKKRKQLKDRRHTHDHALKVRNISLSNWEQELRIVHRLFAQSYTNMPEYEPITFEQFFLVYDDFKYIIHPWYAYIIELNGSPVGFAINYPDPLPVLEKVRGEKLSTLRRLGLLVKLKLNYKTLLMSYMGKIAGPGGEEIKGVPIKVSRKLSSRAFMFRTALYTYVAEGSPSRRGIGVEKLKHHSKYVLYGKEL